MIAIENNMLASGILAGDRVSLSKGITLIESLSARHFEDARRLVDSLFPHSGNSIRIGITGPPGVGKSTFIESFGIHLCHAGHKVAVLAIDPSSSISHGSVLGDKTRMENLVMEKNAYIRPTSTGQNMGGVHNNTREAVILCEAAGFDIILIETVGVGQNEIAGRDMTDIFVLLLPPGGGDELQGIKRGIVEAADMILINKSDMNRELARVTSHDYKNALRLLNTGESMIRKEVVMVSALENEGISEFWKLLSSQAFAEESMHIKEKRRLNQSITWFEKLYKDRLIRAVLEKKGLESQIEIYKEKIRAHKITPLSATYNLLNNI